MWNVLLGIGSNLQPRESVVLAVQHLLASFGSIRLSEVAQTDPVGIASPNLFLNAAALLRSPWQGDELKARLNAIEEAMGRDRSHPDRSSLDRTIDLDVLWAGADATPPAELPAANRPYMRPVYQRFCEWLDDPSTAREPLPSTVALAVNGQSFGREPVLLMQHR